MSNHIMYDLAPVFNALGSNTIVLILFFAIIGTTAIGVILLLLAIRDR